MGEKGQETKIKHEGYLLACCDDGTLWLWRITSKPIPAGKEGGGRGGGGKEGGRNGDKKGGEGLAGAKRKIGQ